MTAATLTSKGQITVPRAVRQSLGLQAGDKVDFVADPSGGFRIVALRKDVKVLRGRFAGRVRRPASLQEMSQAVQIEAAEGSHIPERIPPRTARSVT